MKPNEEIPEEQRERLFLMLRRAMERVSEEYQVTCVGKIPESVNVSEAIVSMQPMWVRELKKIEDQINSYDHTDDAYQKLCDRYVNGWCAIFRYVARCYAGK